MPPLLDCANVGDAELFLQESRLSDFIRGAWHVIEPSKKYLENWHIGCMCEFLQAVDDGQITRLLINIPPRHMKSITVSVMWPVWSWIKRPHLRWMFLSYAASLSTKHNVDRRTIIQSEWYQERWGNRYRLTDDQNVKTEFVNSSRGVMVSTGFHGGATGKGGDRVIIDDAHDPIEAESEVERERTNSIFGLKVSSRIDDKKKDAIVVVGQRVHEKDISSICIEQEYITCILPAEDEPGKIISTPSGKEFKRSDTGLLWPEREGPKEIAQAKRQLGSYGYACQYAQRPAPLGGGKFKSAWFRYFKQEDDRYLLLKSDGSFKSVAIDTCERFGMIDPAGVEKTTDNKPCYTVIQVWDVTPDGNMLLLHQSREMMEIPESVSVAVRIYRQWDLPWIGVEKDGLGIGVVQTMRTRGVAVRPIKAKGSKEARSQTAEIRMEAGMIYFPHNAPFLFDLESELTHFPNSEFKDIVDCLSHAAIWVNRHSKPIDQETDSQWHASKDKQLTDETEEAIERETKESKRMALVAANGDDMGGDWIELGD